MDRAAHRVRQVRHLGGHGRHPERRMVVGSLHRHRALERHGWVQQVRRAEDQSDRVHRRERDVHREAVR